MLTSLQTLNLENCKALISLLPERFGKLKNLKELNLANCDNLMELPEGFEELKSLISLNLQSCQSLQSLPERFGELKSLRPHVVPEARRTARTVWGA